MPPAQRRSAAATAAVAATLVGCAAAATTQKSLACDVIVAGGSLSSLAAAVTAANVSASAKVCFTEITDWPGGQMTASGVPAIDFGPENRVRANMPASLADLLFGPLMPGDTNLGNCWVSTKCFQPQIVVEQWITPLVASFPNLVYLPRTAVTGATRDAATGAITAVTAVQRTPAPGTDGWERLLSEQLNEWYDPAPSAAYPSKTVWTLTLATPAGVVIDATEFGDVLATSGVGFAQGIEAPLENSTSLIGSCGQATTIPFYMSYGQQLAPSPDPVPPGDPEGKGWGMQGENWTRAWTYRRSHAVDHDGINTVGQGEISNQNIGGGNDLINGYVFLATGSPELNAQLAAPGAWRGGVNLTTLGRAEQRSYAFYTYYKGAADAKVHPYLSMNLTQAGTAGGLAKMPYLRDARRSPAGLGGFRVFATDLRTPDPSNNKTATKWKDTIGIGQYFYTDVHKQSNDTCVYPPYMISGKTVLPYYVPFRSLTVDGAPNLLVAGKALAMSFYASAAIRLHPEEWVTGVAAGAAAVLMAQNGWTAADAYANVAQLQALLASPTVGSPLKWTL